MLLGNSDPIRGEMGIVVVCATPILRIKQLRIVERPLHRIERVEQDTLTRRFVHLGMRLLIRRYQYAALRIAQLDQAIKNGQMGYFGRGNCQIKFGTANGGSGWQSLNLQRLIIVADPDFAAQQT